MSEPVKSVLYVTDDNQEAFALVRSTNTNGSLNLIVFSPDTSAPFAANEVPAESDRVK